MEVQEEQWLLHLIVLRNLLQNCGVFPTNFGHRYIEYRTLVRGSLGVLRDVAIDWSNWKQWRVWLVFLNSRV
ncbi:hypothetical protein KC19_5G154100 [Ceratodon purpureus]|uniref:Uncharacterized protein n=1 Tax=Ceratodon purpureus TaxID=3225 RepID=A0A8T0I312_CERPU|nr:hypothetical protein KC19_5G154100 [Ceratodon purpureus]